MEIFLPYKMSFTSILVSTLLICQLGTQNFIQAEIIHGVDVPELDGSKIVGKWYQLNSLEEKDTFACRTNVIERLSKYQYRINATMILTPEAKRSLRYTLMSVVEFSGPFTLQNDSAIIVNRVGNKIGWLTVIFDFDYNSHLVMYATKDKEITTSTQGLIFIFGRRKELPPGIVARTEQSNFYKYGVRSNFRIYPANTYGCIE